MLKFLRKHTKWMLVIFGVFLMIAFVAPEAINNLGGNPATRSIGTVAGRKINPMDLQRAAFELQALERLSPLLVRGVIGIDGDHEHWLLLTLAAEQAGLVGGPDDGEQWLANLAPQLVRTQYSIQFDPATADRIMAMDLGREEVEMTRRALADARPQIARSVGFSLDDFDQTLAKARGIVRMRNLYATANRFSLPRAKRAASDQRLSVYADVLLIDHARVADTVPEPTDAQLRAHFERFRDIPAPGAPNANQRPDDIQLPFGYLRPEGIKIATIELSRTRILAAVEPDPVEANKRWRQNRDLYPGEFAEERLRVISSLREETADRIFEEADSLLRAEVLRAVRRLPQDGPYYRLPDDWDDHAPDLNTIAAEVVAGVERSTGVRIPRPVVEILDRDFLTIADLRRRAPFSNAQVRIGGRVFSLTEFLFSVRELAGAGELGLQVGVPHVAHPAQTGDGANRLYFTILDARPQSPPEFEEIRELVREDVIRLGAYDMLQAQASEIESRGRAEGLRAVARWIEDRSPVGTEPLAFDQMIMVMRDGMMANEASGIDVPQFREAVLAASAGIDPRHAEGAIPPEQAIHAIPVDVVTGLALVRIRVVYPATAEDFRRGVLGEIAQAGQTELFAAQAEAEEVPFSFDRLAERLDYRLRDGTPVRRSTQADTNETTTN